MDLTKCENICMYVMYSCDYVKGQYSFQNISPRIYLIKAVNQKLINYMKIR
jgi:hypothetical protein